MSLPRGVTPEAAAPATTTSSTTMTQTTTRPRLGPLTLATEKLWPRAAERPRLDDTIFLPEGRLEGPTITWKFLCGSSGPPMPQRSMPVPRCPRRYLSGLRIRRETAHKPSRCDVYPRQPGLCRSMGRAANLPPRASGRRVRGWPYLGQVAQVTPRGYPYRGPGPGAAGSPLRGAGRPARSGKEKAVRGVLPKCEPIGTTRASWSFELVGGQGRIVLPWPEITRAQTSGLAQ
jgi:hypothetical protein